MFNFLSNYQFKLPFIDDRIPVQPKSGYITMIKQRIFPHIAFLTFTTLVIAIIIVAFILPRVLYSAPSYEQFLKLPLTAQKLALDVELLHSNKAYIFTLITSLFMHSSYIHFIGNLVVSLFIMYEIEHCWRPSVPFAILAGVAAQCMIYFIGQGIYLGFSGCIAAMAGMLVTAIIMNCPYVRNTYPQQLCMISIFVVFLVLIVVTGDSRALVAHLFGLLFGMLIGIGFWPRSQQPLIPQWLQHIFKAAAIIIIVSLIVLVLFF